MIEIEADGKVVQAHRGEMLLAALTRAGIHVPTLCNIRDMLPTGSCRLCVIEVDSPGAPGLVPACATPVAEGMKVRTSTPRVLRSRKTIVELLLAGHADDCLYCVRNGRCELGALAEQVGIVERRYAGSRREYALDSSSAAIVRDANKCVLCGRCVRVCDEVQSVAAIDFIGRGPALRVGTAFGVGLNVSACVNCGQCIMACPTGALREQSHIKKVLDAIADPDTFTVVQHAPSVSVTLPEELGIKLGPDRDGQARRAAPGDPFAGIVVAALRGLGFDRVFDTAFAADLTVMEEASELAARLASGQNLPMMTSCSPGWTRFVEQFYPDFTGNLSTCKSPQQMMGAIVKGFFAPREGIDPRRIFSVAVMPCTAKKFEAQRPEMVTGGLADVDAVLTTRELARMIRIKGLDVTTLEPAAADTPFGQRSAAGKLFGASGGTMEAVLRTAHFLMTGHELSCLEIKELRGLKGVKFARARIGQRELGVAAVSGLGNARALLEEIRAGRRDIQYIEAMACPGGCIAGGGGPQTRCAAFGGHGANSEGSPAGSPPSGIRSRLATLYRIDRDEPVRTSHANKSVRRLYKEFLGEPLGENSRKFLHTRYDRKEAAK